MEALEQSFEAIGTRWHIALERTKEGTDVHALMERVHERIERFDKDYSRFRDDSLVSRMARSPGTYELPGDAQPLFDLYRDLYRLTDGALTPLIGQTLVDAGYDASYSLSPKTLTRPPSWDEALSYEYPSITLKRPALIDVGAAGKGYLVDLVAGLLKEGGATKFLVDAGGDICVFDSQGDGAVSIGLESPWDASQVIGVASIGNRSICGSSGNRRAWDKYHHIIDPRTLSSPKDIAAVWVVADSALRADALTTALYFKSAETFSSRYTFEYLLLRADHSAEQSAGFPAKLFLAETP